MTEEWHQGIETVVRDDLRFKAKLAIGEDAYKLLKTKNRVGSAWDTYGAVGTGVTIAQSALVAETFFASSTLLGKLTFGALGASAAATPIGWVVAAGVSGGLSFFTSDNFMLSAGYNSHNSLTDKWDEWDQRHYEISYQPNSNKYALMFSVNDYSGDSEQEWEIGYKINLGRKQSLKAADRDRDPY